MLGQRRDPVRDQHRVQSAPDLVGAVVLGRKPIGLQPERVLDGDEVGQTALGLADQVEPVIGGEQFGRPGGRLPPRGRVPTRAVERDGQVEGLGLGSCVRIGGRNL